MTKYVLYSVKPGKEVVWRTWLDKLDKQNRTKVEHILRKEGISNESYVNLQINGSQYCLIIESGDDNPEYDTSPISQKHRDQKRECLVLVDKGLGIQFRKLEN